MKNRYALVLLFTLVLISVGLGRLSAGALLPATHLASSESGNERFLPIIRAPFILFFRANVEIADPGDTIRLEWATHNATHVTLYHLLPTGQLGSFWEVEPAGSFDYTIATSARNQTRFILYAGDDNQIEDATVTVTLTCPDAWFFSPAPDICPAAPAVFSTGAEQSFEHGTMIWIGERDQIYVLFDDDVFSPKWSVYVDEWEEGDALCDAGTPPAGHYQPERGFGLLWCEQPGIRDRLGWAVSPEGGYDTAVQATSNARYNDTYIRALDGNVWRLLPESSGWEKIMADDSGDNHAH